MASELQGRWLTPTQAAARLRCSKLTILRWADSGRLVALATPLGRLIDAADVERKSLERQAQARLREAADA